jgi:hypothetical protein
MPGEPIALVGAVKHPPDITWIAKNFLVHWKHTLFMAICVAGILVILMVTA